MQDLEVRPYAYCKGPDGIEGCQVEFGKDGITVASARLGFCTNLRCGGLALVAAPCRHNHAIPLARESLGREEADAAVGSSDDGDRAGHAGARHAHRGMITQRKGISQRTRYKAGILPAKEGMGTLPASRTRRARPWKSRQTAWSARSAVLVQAGYSTDFKGKVVGE